MIYSSEIERMDVSFIDMSVRLKNGQVILDGVSGVLANSRLTAIMGPSGQSYAIYMWYLYTPLSISTLCTCVKLDEIERENDWVMSREWKDNTAICSDGQGRWQEWRGDAKAGRVQDCHGLCSSGLCSPIIHLHHISKYISWPVWCNDGV